MLAATAGQSICVSHHFQLLVLSFVLWAIDNHIQFIMMSGCELLEFAMLVYRFNHEVLHCYKVVHSSCYCHISSCY